jgi:hypothetical protein
VWRGGCNLLETIDDMTPLCSPLAPLPLIGTLGPITCVPGGSSGDPSSSWMYRNFWSKGMGVNATARAQPGGSGSSTLTTSLPKNPGAADATTFPLFLPFGCGWLLEEAMGVGPLRPGVGWSFELGHWSFKARVHQVYINTVSAELMGL